MKAAGILVTAIIVLAAAQAAAAALYIALLSALVYGVFAYPRETFGLLGFCLLAGLVERHPLPCLSLVALMTVARMTRIH